MRRFAQLYADLDASPGTEDKLAALQRYVAEAPAADAAWAVYLLAGGKPPQAVPNAVLRAAAARAAGLPDWLFDASYQAVGDLAETIALVLPEPTGSSDLGLAQWMTQRLAPLRAQAPEAQAQALTRWWGELPAAQRWVLVKLIGGGWRVGVSKLLVQRALARGAGLDPSLLAQRMMGWTAARHSPDAAALAALLAPAQAGSGPGGQPCPFFLAQPLTGKPADLGPIELWQAEWKYDGMRAQLVRRGAQAWLWSRGEELVSEHFPEVMQWAQALPPGHVLDGELLVWPEGAPQPAPFAQLQRRMARKTLSPRLRAELPVRFIAYDLLEAGGQDLRAQPQWQRRAQLEALLQGVPSQAAEGARQPDLVDLAQRQDAADAVPPADAAPPADARADLAPLLCADDWPALAALRARSGEHGVEGLMLKRRDAPYGSGRGQASGPWLKWKVEPLRIDAVLIYAQTGHGRRAGVYTDYTFAVWSRPPRDAAEAQAVVQAIAEGRAPAPDALQLIPFAKAYSGLSDADFERVDREVRAHTLEKFGPVRSVRPTLVLELACEGLALSRRHRSGVALRFPRMLRLRDDKPLHEADHLATLLALAGRFQAPRLVKHPDVGTPAAGGRSATNGLNARNTASIPIHRDLN